MNDTREQATALLKLLATEPLDMPLGAVAEAVLSCATSLLDAGETRAALEVLEASSRLDGTEGPRWLIRRDLVRARALRQRGMYDECLALVSDLKRRTGPNPNEFPLETAEILIVEGACKWLLNQVDDAVSVLRAVRAQLLTRPDSLQLAHCDFHLATAEYFRGNLSSARRYALDGLVSARRSGDAFAEVISLDNLARVERMACRWSSSEEAQNESLKLALASGMKIQVAIIRRCSAILAWKRGRLNEARSLAEQSIRDFRQLDQRRNEWFSQLLVAMIALHKGDIAAATGILGLWSSSDGVMINPTRASLLTTEFLGDIHLEQEQAEEALKFYDEVWPKTLALVPKGDIVAELRHRRAECYLLLGHNAEAYEEAQTGLQHCRELGDRYEEAATYRVLALAAAAIGKPDEAKQWFDQGFAYYEDIETPFEWGKLWMSYGDWLAGPNAGAHADKRGALDAYRAAEEHFERMGAEGKLAMVRIRLQLLGDAIGTPTSSAAPTMRERLRAPRRPRLTAEYERRIVWARETFGMITRNRTVLDILAQCGKLAENNLPILVLGESGTGKELIAQGIHALSARRGQFLPLNCSAIPHEVFESELFGHVAGAFTGATRDKAGIFETCEGGTVFLDEIGELPVELQARLLRFLESGEFRRVGSSKNMRADTRLVAATNRDRATLRGGPTFRSDLYYRLAHAVVTLPPLRQRGDDIEMLIEHFLERLSMHARKAVFLSDDAWARLVEHPWPGNIRELRSTIQRIVVLATPGAEVTADSFELDDSDVPTTLNEETAHAEIRRIEDAIQKSAGNKSEAARLLGLSRTTMLSKMKRYGMSD